MNVKIIKTGKIETVNASYGARLIEQGKAVLAAQSTEEKTAEKPMEKKAAKKSGDA